MEDVGDAHNHDDDRVAKKNGDACSDEREDGKIPEAIEIDA